MDQLKHHIKGSRQQYDKDKLSEEDLTESPFDLFAKWLQLAVDTGVHEPIAMNLATVKIGGQPSSRIVLMRGFDENGIVFFSNYDSKKGIQIEAHPAAAVNFYWQELHKQIRIEGIISKVADSVSEEYFISRPRESQIGAWASLQSHILKNRQELNEQVAAIEKKYENSEVPRPPNWGGYLLKPHIFEFWQGRLNRLHDRFQYTLLNDTWKIDRLSP